MARTVLSSRELTVCSFHTPPGSSWGAIKPQTMKAIAAWLAEQSGSIVLGIDANAPKIDHPNPGENKWWWADEPLLLGATPLHQLKDAFRIVLKEHPLLLEEIRKERPAGPLAISHYRGRGIHKTPCRYDFIFISPDIMVGEMTHTFYETLSDHALVAAQLELPDQGQQESGHAGRPDWMRDDNLEDDVLIGCALRFDGWQYEIDAGQADRGGLASLVRPILKERRFHSDPNDNLAAFFALQRYLYKRGGETLPLHSPEHVAFRLLFLDVYRCKISDRYRKEPYWQRWEDRYRPRQEYYASIIRQTFRRKGRPPKRIT